MIDPIQSVDAFVSPEVHDRARGALLGLAVGDALGTTLEFTERDRQPHHTEMTGGGPFDLQPGVTAQPGTGLRHPHSVSRIAA